MSMGVVPGCVVVGGCGCWTSAHAVEGECGCSTGAHAVMGECRDSIRHVHTPTSHSVKYSTPITSKFVFHFRYIPLFATYIHTDGTTLV